ncbi:MAG: hypothetical protein AAB575_01105 [Patescibacteria group bacterium]
MDFNKKQKNNDLLKLIKDSYLADAEKKVLLAIYENHGVSAEFLQKFETGLVDMLKQKTSRAIGISKEIEAGFAEIRDDYKKQRDVLTAGLQKDIAEIESTDVSAKTKLWDVYYDKVDELQKDIATSIQKISQKVLIEFAE